MRVLWVFRKSQWLALLTPHLDLSVDQIIDYYEARRKIEAGLREIKQEIGSSESQTRKAELATDPRHFRTAATIIT